MAAIASRRLLPGSERPMLPGARMLKTADPHERISVTILLRRPVTSHEFSSFLEKAAAQPLRARLHLSREEFATTHGATSEDIDKIEAFAHDHDLDVMEVHAAQRRVVLSGTTRALNSAFGVTLQQYTLPAGEYRGHTGPLHVPADLVPLIQGIFGLDNRPQARPHFRLLTAQQGVARPRTTETSYTPLQIAQLYDFPTGRTGKGQCIALIELGGGYRRADLITYFSRMGVPFPTVRSRSVDRSHNQPEGNPDGADGEVLLDIEVAGAVAPGAKIVVYFAPNTDAGFLDAVMTAIHDQHNKPSVISISWGAPESEWTAQAMHAMDHAFQDAAALGVTVCCASGDDGSSDRVTDGRAHVDFPASSPYVLGCGGTRLEGVGTTIARESVWNENGHGATGGGVSDIFALPHWQVGARVPPSANPTGRSGRGVPDVAGDADPLTGYQVFVDGQSLVIGGTSPVAPLWAGLIALLNQQLSHPAGYLNNILYSIPKTAKAFHDITTGDNGAYSARAGWDACTGLGTPDGAKLLSVLSEQ